MTAKKIFYKKDYKDILLFLKEDGLATLNNNYKGCKLELEDDGSHFNLIITDSLNVKYKEFSLVLTITIHYTRVYLNTFQRGKRSIYRVRQNLL